MLTSLSQNCFLLRSGTIAWFGGGSSTTFALASNFGAAASTDSGQEVNAMTYKNVTITSLGVQGLNTRQATPPSIASSPWCAHCFARLFVCLC